MILKIDTHQHFWEYSPQRDTWINDSMQVLKKDYLPADLWSILQKNNIEGCLAVQADQSETETNFLLKLADENDFIKGVIGWVDLCADTVNERLEFFSKQPKFKGVRHIVQAETEDYLLREDFQNGISKLEQYNLIYELLIRKEQLPHALKLIKKFPNQTFVLNHIAKPAIKAGVLLPWKTQMEQLAAYSNVYCKVSGLVTEADWKNWRYNDFVPYLDVIFNTFDKNRLMFGSDWPVCLLAGNYEESIAILEKYLQSYSATIQQKIMGANAVKCYNL